MSLYRAQHAGLYIFWEMVPSFVLGNIVFIFILLMFQVLRLSEFIIIHGVGFATILKLVTYMTISFLPACIPISLLFSILLTYGRLSSDSEIVAFKASGLHMGHLLVPAVALGMIVAAVSAYVSFYGAPWGNRGFEVLFTRLANTKAAATIQEGVFSEGFFDLVLYADKVDSKHGRLKKVFIYDEREGSVPVTVIAQEGLLIDSDPNFPGKGVTLRLVSGNIHRTSDDNYTKVDFKAYDISLTNTAADAVREKSPPSYTYNDLRDEMKNPKKDLGEHRVLVAEYHKRWALAFACIVFGILGVGAGTFTNRRAVRASGLVVSLIIMVSYWVLYISGESLARNGTIPAWLAMWMANFIFGTISIWTVKRSW
ncbi:MAG: LPS export ABC transporter permease LptF [Oligoflexia bacterium]|nr:LPS export ABC transporter permease LptF [Oligoflexia bacterium]